MNTDERRAFKILCEKFPDNLGLTYHLFMEFLKYRKQQNLPDYPKPQDLANEFLEFESLKENRIECPYCGCHILPKYYLDHICICRKINERQTNKKNNL